MINFMTLGIIDKILDVLGGIFSIIPKLLYFIVSAILSLIDLCQISFRKLAGLDPIIIDGEVYVGDTVYKIISDALFGGKYPAIRTVFWAVIALGVAMLFFTSIIAVIRLEYSPDKDKGNSKMPVIRNFFKALFSFAIIPVACLFGMYLANSMVSIIDSATAYPVTTDNEVVKYFNKWSSADSDPDSPFADNQNLQARADSYTAYNIFGLIIPTTGETFSGIIFRACGYNSNRIRKDKDYYLVMQELKVFDIIDQIDNQEQAANLIDTGFAINARLKGTYNLSTSAVKSFFRDYTDWFPGSYKNVDQLSKYNVDAVFYFYNLWTFNYIIAFVAILTIGKMFFNFVLFLMQRMFEIIGLFLISPIAVGIMPLDNGAGLTAWRQQMVIKFALLIIMVTTFNLMTPLITVAENISFFGIKFVDYIITTFFLIAAFNSITSLNSTLTKIFTGDHKNFDQVGAAGEQITKNFTAGLGAAASTAKFAAAISPVGLGAKAIGSYMSHSKNTERDRNIAAKQVKFGKNSDGDFSNSDINKNWGKLSGAGAGSNRDDDRGLNTVNGFLNTTEGQDFINTYYGGSRTRAQRALRGTHGQDVADVDARRQYEQYLHDKKNFDKSSVALQNGVGSANYWAEFDTYRKSSFDQKVDYFTGSDKNGLTSRQNRIKGRMRFAENTAKVTAPVAKGVAKVGSVGGKMIKPLAGLVSVLPFTQLIGDSLSAIFGPKKTP